MSRQPVGKTKEQGWEIGVRRTFPVTSEQAWELMVTQPGISLWLGDDPDLKFEKGAIFHTTDGTTGQIVGFKEGSLLRLRWQPQHWAEPSTLQLRIIPAGEKATISIHHERLVDEACRQQMKHHWDAALDQIQKMIAEGEHNV